MVGCSGSRVVLCRPWTGVAPATPPAGGRRSPSGVVADVLGRPGGLGGSVGSGGRDRGCGDRRPGRSGRRGRQRGPSRRVRGLLGGRSPARRPSRTVVVDGESLGGVVPACGPGSNWSFSRELGGTCSGRRRVAGCDSGRCIPVVGARVSRRGAPAGPGLGGVWLHVGALGRRPSLGNRGGPLL